VRLATADVSVPHTGGCRGWPRGRHRRRARPAIGPGT